MIDSLFILYVLIGCFVCFLDWIKFYKEEYNKAKEKDDNALIIYWLFAILLWPLLVIKLIFKKK